MTDVYTYNGCPICYADDILIINGVCQQCGYDGSETGGITYQQTMNATTNGNIAVYGTLPNGTTFQITGDRHLGCTFSVPKGTKIKLVSAPVAHYNTLTWTGKATEQIGGGTSVTVNPTVTTVVYTVSGVHSFGATYDIQCAVTFTRQAHGTVTATYTLAGVLTTSETWTNTTKYVDNNTTCILTQVPSTGYVMGTWAGTRFSSAQNVAITVTWIVANTTATIALTYTALTATFDGFAYCNASGTPSIIGTYSSDGKNITIKFTPPTGQAVAAAYTANITDGDEVLTPSVASNGFTMDLEEIKHYYCIVVFGAA